MNTKKIIILIFVSLFAFAEHADQAIQLELIPNHAVQTPPVQTAPMQTLPSVQTPPIQNVPVLPPNGVMPAPPIPDLEKKPEHDFYCKCSGNRCKPAHIKIKKALGSGSMSKTQCRQAVEASKLNIVCSSTDIGFKPTYMTGTTQSRPDYGYIGGTSIPSFKQCIAAVEAASKSGVCYCGDSTRQICKVWYIGNIQGKKRGGGGSFRTHKACIAKTAKTAR